MSQRGLLRMGGLGPMCIQQCEDAIVERTEEVFPGLVIAGIAAAETFGLPGMGPTFGAMFLSGRRAAEIARERVGQLAGAAP